MRGCDRKSMAAVSEATALGLLLVKLYMAIAPALRSRSSVSVLWQLTMT